MNAASLLMINCCDFSLCNLITDTYSTLVFAIQTANNNQINVYWFIWSEMTVVHYKPPVSPLSLNPRKTVQNKKKKGCLTRGLEKTNLQIFELAKETLYNRLAYWIFTIDSSYWNKANAAHAHLDDWLFSAHSSDFAGPLRGIKHKPGNCYRVLT